MIVNRNESSTLVKNSVRIIDKNGQMRTDVDSIDLGSMQGTSTSAEAIDAGEFFFVVGSQEDEEALKEELPEDMHFLIRVSAPEASKPALVTSDSHCLTVIIPTAILVAVCSNCGTHFMLAYGAHGKLMSLNKPNATDVNFTLTEIDEASMTCDNCGVNVEVVQP